MADPIETWRIVQFQNHVEHLLQEKGGKLRQHCMYRGDHEGKLVAPVNQVGPTTASKVVDRLSSTPNNKVPLDRRWLAAQSYEWGHMIDDFDRLTIGIQPDGEFTKAGAMAMARAEDDVIMGAFFGDALAGENADNGSFSRTVTFPTENVVAQTEGPTTGINHDKLLATRELLAANEVDLDTEELCMIITEKDVTDLFGFNATTSTDFVEGRPVSTGKLPNLYGFNFIPLSTSTLKRVGLLDDAGLASLPAWVKSGMHLGVWKEKETRIAERPDVRFNMQIYMKQTMNATRLQEGKVIKVESFHAP